MVGQHRRFGRERPPGVGKRLPGRSVAVGAIRVGLHYVGAGRDFALFHQRECAGGVWRIAGQHRDLRDQLLVGLHGDRGFVPIEALGGTLAPVAHLRIMQGHQPIRCGPFQQRGTARAAFHVLAEHAAQQTSCFEQRSLLWAASRQRPTRPPRPLQQAVSVGHQLTQEPLAGPGVAPVNSRAPFHARLSDVAGVAGGAGPRDEAGAVATAHPSLGGEHLQHRDDPIGHQMGGGFDGAPAHDRRGVQR